MVFREVVCQVFRSFLPVDSKLPLMDTIMNPIKSHVNCFQLSLFDLIVYNAVHDCIIHLDGCCWLWVAQCFKCCMEHCAILCIIEESSNFCLGCGGQD